VKLKEKVCNEGDGNICTNGLLLAIFIDFCF